MNVKTIIKTTAVSGLGAFMLIGLASAQGENNSLVDKLANKFHLNKTEVQQVFDEHKQERRQEMEKRYEERLTQAVKDGKLTEEQKIKLLAKHKELVAEMEKKHAEMKAKRGEMGEKSQAERQKLHEERRAEIEKKRAELEQWEKDNNIPSGYLMLGGPGGRGHGMRHR